MIPAVFYISQMFNCSPPPSTKNLAKPALQWGSIFPTTRLILRPKGVPREGSHVELIHQHGAHQNTVL